MNTETGNDLGPLAVALSKAQGEFGPITRDKTVTVQKKSGGSYTFAYAPLDQIMNTVRGPLRDNGLTLTQILDAEGLVTMLIHESGACLRGITPLPETTDVQAFGSAITYLRRYSVVSILGIATEEDDDGNRAAGNQVRDGRAAPHTAKADPVRAATRADEPELIGPYSATGAIGVNPKAPADGFMRQEPDGALVMVTFTDTENHKIPQVMVRGALASDLLDSAAGDLKGLVCTISGDLYRVPWFKDAKPMPPFQRLELHHIDAAGWSLPMPAETTGPVATPDAAGVPSEEPAAVPPAPSLPMFDEATEAELDGALR